VVALHLPHEGQVGLLLEDVDGLALSFVEQEAGLPSLFGILVPRLRLLPVPVEVEVEVLVHLAAQILGSEHGHFLLLPFLDAADAVVGDGLVIVVEVFLLLSIFMAAGRFGFDHELPIARLRFLLQNRVKFAVVEKLKASLGLA
jgi:hypothetical protein